jgi:hypothetical protein
VAAALIVGAALSGGRGVGGTARAPQADKFREWAEREFPHLVRPTFAKLELARMLPELNEEPDRANAPFRSGESINFRLLIINDSDKTVVLRAAGGYTHNRLQLFRGESAVPYSQSVEQIVRAEESRPGYRNANYEELEPKHTLTEVISLADWYEPLRPGRYRLVVRHCFIWSGEWLESPPLTFEVVP